MATSESQKAATKRYREKNYDAICFYVKKGKRDEYKKAAKALGLESFWSFLLTAMDEFIERHKDGAPLPIKLSQVEWERGSLTGRENVLMERFRRLPEKVQKDLVRLMGDLVEQLEAGKAGGDTNGVVGSSKAGES